MQTHITLTPTECAVRFPDGTLLTVREDGVMSLSKSGATLVCEPMRLRGDQTFGSQTESFFGSEKVALTRDLSLSLIVDYSSEKLRAELFFQEREGTAKCVSGCYITKENADWAVRLLDAERLQSNLSALFSISAGFSQET